MTSATFLHTPLRGMSPLASPRHVTTGFAQAFHDWLRPGECHNAETTACYTVKRRCVIEKVRGRVELPFQDLQSHTLPLCYLTEEEPSRFFTTNDNACTHDSVLQDDGFHLVFDVQSHVFAMHQTIHPRDTRQIPCDSVAVSCEPLR